MNHLSDEVRATIKELTHLLLSDPAAGTAKIKEMEAAATPLWFALMDALRAASGPISDEVTALIREVHEERNP